MSRWNNHFMRLAREESLMSKDPSTKVGAVIVKDRHVVGAGWNGFPKSIKDDYRIHIREEKLELIIHAEMNALLDAGHRARGGTLYLYGFRSSPCRNCTKHIIQMGIEQIYACGPELPERWKDSVERAEKTLVESGGNLQIIDELSL